MSWTILIIIMLTCSQSELPALMSRPSLRQVLRPPCRHPSPVSQCCAMRNSYLISKLPSTKVGWKEVSWRHCRWRPELLIARPTTSATGLRKAEFQPRLVSLALTDYTWQLSSTLWMCVYITVVGIVPLTKQHSNNNNNNDRLTAFDPGQPG